MIDAQGSDSERPILPDPGMRASDSQTGPGMIAKDTHERRPIIGIPSLDILLNKLERITDGRYTIEGIKTGQGLQKKIEAKVGQKILTVNTVYPFDEPIYLRIFRLKGLLTQLLRAIAAEGLF